MHDRPDIGRLEADVAAVRELIARGRDPVHLLGIGGVGMAGVALMLKARGLRVSGCDVARGAVVAWLEREGIPVAAGHDPAHLRDRPAWLVRSPAVRHGEVELAAARAAGLPVFARGVVLPALLQGRRSIAVSGAHGKTTTTAMIAHVLRGCAVDASFCVGGIVAGDGMVAAAGRDPVMVVEADESDGTLALYAPDIAVVTNVELDHVDHFRTRDELDACFRRLGAQSGHVIYGADDPGARALFDTWPGAEGFGLSAGRWRATGLVEEPFAISFDVSCDGQPLGRVELAAPGRHNVLNALAALAVCACMRLPFRRMADALRTFAPVRRRFEVLANAGSRIVISDYAHHPTEIRALLAQAARLPCRRILAVFQPHRYTRTAAMGREFAQAFNGVDYLVLAPTYAAFEDPVPGGGIRDLAALFEASNRVPSWCADSLLAAWEHIREKWRDGDVLLIVGAGDVEKIALWARDHVLNPEPRTPTSP